LRHFEASADDLPELFSAAEERRRASAERVVVETIRSSMPPEDEP
jgi:hypothetical protein